MLFIFIATFYLFQCKILKQPNVNKKVECGFKNLSNKKLNFPYNQNVTLKILNSDHAFELNRLVLKNKEHLKNYMQPILNAYSKLEHTFDNLSNIKNKYNYGIWYNEHLVGQIGFHSPNYYYDGSIEVFYWIDKDFQGKGIVKKALKKLIKIGLVKLNFKRINAMIYTSNYKSIRLAYSVGMSKAPYEDLKKYKKWPYEKRKSNEIETKTGKIPQLFYIQNRFYHKN